MASGGSGARKEAAGYGTMVNGESGSPAGHAVADEALRLLDLSQGLEHSEELWL